MAPTARERARAEITREILETGRAHLARDGAAALSLRAVARDLGMASSAVYRYVPNRDALLTLLIIDAYDAVGEQVEQAAAACPVDDHLARFLATCRALRTWALAHPQEYALIYGSPVPGYAAPVDTVAPATRVPTVLLSILFDQTAAGTAPPPAPLRADVAASIGPFREFAGGGQPQPGSGDEREVAGGAPPCSRRVEDAAPGEDEPGRAVDGHPGHPNDPNVTPDVARRGRGRLVHGEGERGGRRDDATVLHQGLE